MFSLYVSVPSTRRKEEKKENTHTQAHKHTQMLGKAWVINFSLHSREWEIDAKEGQWESAYVVTQGHREKGL